MSSDEKTTEIEIPIKRVDNILHVDFLAAASEGKAKVTTTATASTTSANPAIGPSPVAQFRPKPKQRPPNWLSKFDLASPWTLRLLAVLVILILSLLIV